MDVLRQIKRGLDRGLETLVWVTMAVLVLDVTLQVVARYILTHISKSLSFPWTEELATFLLVWVGLLGASVALHHRAHLGIDYFVSKLPPSRRRYTELFALACVALFSFTVMGIAGTSLVIRTFGYGQVSPALELPMGYVYLAVPISGFFLTLYAVIGMLERFQTLSPKANRK